jgi:hypothetical protein
MLSQQDIEEQQFLLKESTYTAWLYENYPIGNGDMLLHYLEDGNTRALYLSEHGLDIDSDFYDDKGNVL